MFSVGARGAWARGKRLLGEMCHILAALARNRSSTGAGKPITFRSRKKYQKSLLRSLLGSLPGSVPKCNDFQCFLLGSLLGSLLGLPARVPARVPSLFSSHFRCSGRCLGASGRCSGPCSDGCSGRCPKLQVDDRSQVISTKTTIKPTPETPNKIDTITQGRAGNPTLVLNQQKKYQKEHIESDVFNSFLKDFSAPVS